MSVPGSGGWACITILLIKWTDMISTHMCKNIEKEIQPGRAKSTTTTYLEDLHLPLPLPSLLLCTQFCKIWVIIGALLAKVLRTCLQLAHSDLGLRGRIRVVNSEREKEIQERQPGDLGPETICCSAYTWTNIPWSNAIQRNYKGLKLTASSAGGANYEQ